MKSLDLIFVFTIIGLTSANAMSIKRSENNVEKVEDAAYRVNYDVYPVRHKSFAKCHSTVIFRETIKQPSCAKSSEMCVKFIINFNRRHNVVGNNFGNFK